MWRPDGWKEIQDKYAQRDLVKLATGKPVNFFETGADAMLEALKEKGRSPHDAPVDASFVKKAAEGYFEISGDTIQGIRDNDKESMDSVREALAYQVRRCLLSRPDIKNLLMITISAWAPSPKGKVVFIPDDEKEKK